MPIDALAQTMARAPLLQLNDISLNFGGDTLFDTLDLVVQPGDRLALVGRNGSGKSTLMKVMAGLVEADRGVRFVAPRLKPTKADFLPTRLTAINPQGGTGQGV